MGLPNAREAAVAGSFYTGDARALARQVRDFLDAGVRGEVRTRAVAVMVPHAGYIYSGRVAGMTYARVSVPARVVVLAVNHRGLGAPFASWDRGVWRTPLGELVVDTDMITAIARRAAFLIPDACAHDREHSLEVQLPFLQSARREPPLLTPIAIASSDPVRLTELGLAVADAVRDSGDEVLVVASTDMSHYVPASVARSKDALALACVEAVDGPSLLETVRTNEISMCGVAPTTAALIAARSLGARTGSVIAYGNSGEASGDFESVVGYAGAVLS